VFDQLQSDAKRWSAIHLSLAAHLVLLVALLTPPAPRFVKPSSVAFGKGGSSVAYLLWPGRKDGLSGHKSARLSWNRPAHKRKPDKRPLLSTRVLEDEEASSAPRDVAPASGAIHGSLAYGAAAGYEVRPAIRVSGSEPYVTANDLAGVREGNIIIEVTIDERGNIIQKTVLQSLGPSVDNKVLAALEDWHFLPATQDGAAIASKQDVYYHFPVRR
jgi:protein TonB